MRDVGLAVNLWIVLGGNFAPGVASRREGGIGHAPGMRVFDPEVFVIRFRTIGGPRAIGIIQQAVRLQGEVGARGFGPWRGQRLRGNRVRRAP